jgi:hypothetical protein
VSTVTFLFPVTFLYVHRHFSLRLVVTDRRTELSNNRTKLCLNPKTLVCNTASSDCSSRLSSSVAAAVFLHSEVLLHLALRTWVSGLRQTNGRTHATSDFIYKILGTKESDTSTCMRSPWVASCRYLLPLQCAQNELQQRKGTAYVRNAPDNHSEELLHNPRDAFPVGQERDSR